ncbi:MAG: AAA family ATPase [Candidatus Sumerlaeota bacterium]|nr:AAA family ATPase [Candidatus Sumerlaeota bacterium]
MYRKFFGLEEDPFNLTPDTRFLYLSRKHREALANLIYGIQERKGFITLTGEIGSGKTTLCRALVNELDPKTTKVALIFNSYLSEIELLQTINEDFGIASESNSKRDLIKALNQFLLDENAAGHNVVLIIDEAQNLTAPVLEQIRMLSNLETETEKLIQIVLMAQPELLDILAQPELEQLNQRVAVRYHIFPLDEDDLVYYIRHRLFVAKAQIDIEFTPDALKLIYQFSGGIPRKINVLCDRCLLDAYTKVTYAIDRSIVKEAILEIEGEQARAVAKVGGRASRPAVRFSNLAILTGILCLIVIVGVVLGINLARSRLRSIASATERGLPKPKDASLEGTQEAASEPSYKVAWKQEPSSLSQEEEPTPTPQPTPTKPPQRYFFNWDYDKDNVCRVDNTKFTYAASIFTCLRLWNIEVDLTDFKNMDVKTIQRLNLTQNEKIGLEKHVIEGDLATAARFDIPVILTYNIPPKGLSPAIVLVRMEGMSCTIADPMSGLRTISRNALTENLRQCIVIYFDTLKLDTLVKGEESERVKILQTFLQKKGFLKGEATGIFDQTTESGIRNFQRYYKIELPELLNTDTVLMLSTRMVTMRPRLFSSGGQD